MLLEETVRNVYFWSNVVALGLLGCLFIIIVFQHRIQAKREWTAAEMLRQFEQSLARSRAQVEEATQKESSPNGDVSSAERVGFTISFVASRICRACRFVCSEISHTQRTTCAAGNVEDQLC